MNTAATPNIFDGSNLTALKRLTHQNDPEGIKQAAQQFEALFVQMMLKSMRDATPKDELMGSDQQRMYESLLDQQLAQVMSTRKGGMGLAAMIEKQMTQTPPNLDGPTRSIPFVPAARDPIPLSGVGKEFLLANAAQERLTFADNEASRGARP